MMPIQLREVSQDRGTGRRAVRVLHRISFHLEAGELVLLQGPSGSGKTTLLGVAAGLLTPAEGDVTLAGRSLGTATPAERRALRSTAVGFVFQRGNLVAGLTARANVQLMASLSGMHRLDGSREADAILERLGVAHIGNRYPHELSGGEEQRVAVARALVHRPAVVLADEPTGSLDGPTGHAVAEALVDLARSRGSGVLISTHDPRLVPFATRHVRILDGRLES